MSTTLPMPAPVAANPSIVPAPTPTVRPASTSLLHRILRRICSFPGAIAGLFAALAVLTARGRFDDPDLWWHLKTGEAIWNTHAIPVVDLFSFSAARHAWIPHEWLSQWAMYAIWHLAGARGLMVAFACLAAAVLVAGYTLCVMYAQNAKVAFLGALTLFVFATTGFSMRPQLLGYLFLIAEMIILHLGRSRSSRWFFALPVLFALWVNCHGSFFFGLAVIGALLCSSFFRFEVGSFIGEQWSKRRRKQLILAFALSAAATLVNPDGLRQVLYPLDTLLRQPINLAFIDEWQPLQLSSQRGICVLVVMGTIFLLVALRKAVLYLDEVILLAIGLWLAGSHVRMLFVFGILAAPILSRILAGNWENYNPRKDRIFPNAVLLVLSAVTVVIAFPSAQSLTHQVEEQSPVKAVEFIHSHHLTGPMLNEYSYGGYLIWAAPDHPVFIDGRADLYEWAGVLGQYAQWATMQGDPNTLLDKYGIQFCLLSAQSPMVRVLRLLPGWQTTYTDSNAVIFTRIPKHG